MAFPSLSAQQETNRKILEDLQLKKQLLQRGVSPVAPTISGISNVAAVPNVSINQVNHLQTQSTDFIQSSPASRSAFNLANTATFGFFVPQDSFYGNTFLPVIPRLEPLPQAQPK